MSVLSDILERLTALTNWKNSVTANAKTTSELDAQGTLNTSSLIRVSISGVSQFITVQQIVDAATLSTNNVGTNGIVSGTIEYVEGLIYRTLNLVYRINNVLYYSNGFSIILNAGGTLKRTDVIYGDAELDGQILVLEGEEATVPIKPIVQWGYQLELTFATIATSATAPEGVSEFTLYDENLQQAGGEYNTSTNTPLQVDLANTTLFNTGAKSIKFINAGTVGFNLTSTVKKDGANISFVKFRVYLTDANKSHRLQLSFWVNNTLRTGDITVTHGMFNFDSYLINTWQTIVIPGTAFAVNGVWGAFQYDDLYFQNRRSGCTFYVDTITIQEGVTTQNNTSNHTHANYSILEQITQEMLDNIGATVDISGKEDTTNKQNSLATDGTGAKYPTVDAVNAGLSTKLNTADYNQHFKGKYLTAVAMRTAHPTGVAGDYAQVNEVGATDVLNYNWDAEENIWIPNAVAGSGATNTDQLPEGTSNLYFNGARILNTLLTGISFLTGTAVVATDSILVGFGKLQKQITDLTTVAKTEYISYACSDEITDLTLGDKITIRMPFAMTLSEVRLSLNVAPTITKLIVDVKENGVSIFSTLPSIDTTELTSVTAAIPPVISDVNLADDAVLVVSVSQLGSGDIGKGLKITLKGIRI